MRRRTTALLAAVLALAACGTEGGGDVGVPDDPDEPVLQIRSEGGFATPEMILGRGPTYTLLVDRSLIYEGPMILIYPPPLLPNYQIGEITDDQMDEVLRLVDEIGLPDMTDERDEKHGETVADATTEVITYWDSDGNTHSYSVYALGIDPSPSNPATAAFLELFNLMPELAASVEAEPFEGEVVQMVAGVGFADPDFPDVRDWPLEDDDPSGWTTLPNGWLCETTEEDVLGLFADATQNTQWTDPTNPDSDPLKLLVRPLHPGEEHCFGN